MSDAALARLRGDLYSLANIAVTLHERDKNLGSDEAVLRQLSSEDRESVEERAAVLEFDAGMSRSAATRKAVTGHLRARNGRKSESCL